MTFPRSATSGLWAGIKRIAEVSLTASGVAGGVRYLNRRRVVILAYHNVVPDDEAGRGDRSLHLPVSRFLRQLDRLARSHFIVPLADAVEQPASRPRAVITFDDAYRGAVDLALPELRSRGLPATVFVSPGLLGATSVWWDDLAERDVLTPERRRMAIFDFEGRPGPVRRWGLGDETPCSLPTTYGIATEAELRDQVMGTIQVGGHGWDHTCLPALGPDELRRNLRRTMDWLADFPSGVKWLALPYGAGGSNVARAALDLGYRGVLEISGGLCPARPDPACIPRINVPAGMSSRGLALRASGLVR